MTTAPKTERTRIPEGRLEKAHFFVAMAQAELAKGRLQSAETFFRLAASMDPSDLGIVGMLQEIVSKRDQLRSAHP